MNTQDHLIVPISALKDNYIWMLLNEKTSAAWIVDPGEASPVFEYLKQHHINLHGIFVTHHHWDHTNGIADLIQTYPIQVIGSIDSCCPHISKRVANDEILTLEAWLPKIRALSIPGHTLDHTAYAIGKALFTGDTLFGAGCGRLFEGSPEQMYQSLQKLANLPEDTQIYCGHEYTLANLRFAAVVEPQNEAISQRIEKTQVLRDKNCPSLPSLLSEEKQTNPFLRSHVLAVQEQVSAQFQRKMTDPIEVFAALRQWKNVF